MSLQKLNFRFKNMFINTYILCGISIILAIFRLPSVNFLFPPRLFLPKNTWKKNLVFLPDFIKKWILFWWSLKLKKGAKMPLVLSFLVIPCEKSLCLFISFYELNMLFSSSFGKMMANFYAENVFLFNLVPSFTWFTPLFLLYEMIVLFYMEILKTTKMVFSIFVVVT